MMAKLWFRIGWFSSLKTLTWANAVLAQSESCPQTCVILPYEFSKLAAQFLANAGLKLLES